MSRPAANPPGHRGTERSGVDAWPVQALRVGALVALCSAAAVYASVSLSRLQAVVGSVDSASHPESLVWSAGALVAAAVFVLLVEVANIVRRFRTPEQQVRLAMQRIRAGDVGFRIARRRGEPLGRLVADCNDMLEWLNRNPPDGVRVDRDVFELDEVDCEEARQ